MCREISVGAFLVSTVEKTNSYAEGSPLEYAWLDACQAPALGAGVSWGMQVPGPLLLQSSFSQ